MGWGVAGKRDAATAGLTLDTKEVGAHPLVQPLLDRLRVREFLAQALGPPDPRAKLAAVDSALLLVRNFVLSRHPLYEVPAWARRFAPDQLALSAAQIALLNDDRLGRALDKLFVADRRTVMTRLVVHAVKEFRIALSRLHNDSTSITFCGLYRDPPPRPDARRRLRIVHGHNKDHRPDLKQLVWTITVSGDGAVPVHYNADDGNITDDTTHVRTWQVLREITGRADFLYVADCKLCTRANMGYIDAEGGRFITVLPGTRKEDGAFRQGLVDHGAPWQLIWERAPQRRKDDPPERFEAVEGPPSAEGYRIVWFRSSEKWKRDEQARTQLIQQARYELQRLRERVGRRKLRTRPQVEAAARALLDETGAQRWLRVEVVATAKHVHKQAGPGRPGKHTRYVRMTTTIYEPVAVVDAEAVRASAVADGIFPLVTNQGAAQLSALQVLQTYKYQAFIEKRHEQLKTAAEVVPVNYKSVERIEAFLFLYFVAVMIQALLERQVRMAMTTRKLRSIPLYPEDRACRAPTADKVIGLFEPVRRHVLFDQDRLLKTFWDPLNDVQRLLLDLLEVPTSQYGQ